MSTAAELCALCAKGARRNGNLHPCYYCDKKFHSQCNMVQFTLEDGSQARICIQCQKLDESQMTLSQAHSKAQENLLKPPNMRRHRASSATSYRSISPHSSAPSSASSSAFGSASSLQASLERELPENTQPSAVQLLLAKLSNLDKLDKLENLEKLDTVIENTKDLPDLLRKVEANTVAISELQTKQGELTQRHQDLEQRVEGIETRSSTEAETAAEEKVKIREEIRGLRTANEKLTSQLRTFESEYKKSALSTTNVGGVASTGGQGRETTRSSSLHMSTKILLSGLTTPEGTNERKLAYAVLKRLYADLEPFHVPLAYRMKTKPPRFPGTAASTSGAPGSSSAHGSVPKTIHPSASSSSAETVLASSSTTDASSNFTTDTSAALPESAENQSINRPPLLVVHLSSPSLLRSIISAKVKLGKFHTSSVDAQLLLDAGVNTSLPPALINVNEYLASEVYRLHRRVREMVKNNNSLTSFTRAGQIYIRKKKEDTSTAINSIEDLQPFMQSSSTPPQT